MPTPSSLAGRLTRFSMLALERGSALAAQPHVVTHLGGQTALVSWATADPPDLSNVSMEDIRSYLFFLENDHFSIVCQDGSLIQMSFKIHRGSIVHHRLCYLPCPVQFDQAELIEDSLYTVVERNLNSRDYNLVRYRGGIRFDFDPAAARSGHPSSHLTLNYDNVRVPVGRSLDAGTFLTFVDDHLIGSRDHLTRLSLSVGADDTRDVLAVEDRGRLHLSWHSGAG